MDNRTKEVAELLRGELVERLKLIENLGACDEIDRDLESVLWDTIRLCEALAEQLEMGEFPQGAETEGFKDARTLTRILQRLTASPRPLDVSDSVRYVSQALGNVVGVPALQPTEEEAEATDEPETEQEAEAEPYGGASLGLFAVRAFPDRRAVRTFLLSEQFNALWTAISFGYAIETDHPRLPSSFASEVGVATCAAFEDMRVLAREAARAEAEPFRLVQSDYNAVDERRAWLGLLGSLGTICDMVAADELGECVDLHVDLIDQAQARGEAA